jgi:hypothetical protein
MALSIVKPVKPYNFFQGRVFTVGADGNADSLTV